MKNFIKMRMFNYGTYLLLVLATLLVGYVLLNNNKSLNTVITSFFEVAENRSFDYRQVLKVNHKQPVPNKDIVVLAIDDASLEQLWDKYGEWPVPREVYANAIHYIEAQNPQSIIFDLMFIKSMKSSKNSDEALIKAMNKYDNIYTAMTFDNQPNDLRVPIDLPERLALNIDNKSKIKFSSKYGFANCRSILPELLNGKVHVGLANVIRHNDGIIRKIGPILEYKGKNYPYLTFTAATNYLAEKDIKDFIIDKKGNLIVEDVSLPLTSEGELILNWYGKSGTHTIYPMYKLINEITTGKKDFDFKDKVVIIGTTAMSLHDTKSVPVQDNVYPGVEVHATFFNNMLDNNFIKQTSSLINLIVVASVVILVGLIVMLSTSTIFALLSTTLFGIAYLFISYYLLEIHNLWLPVVLPVISMVLAFSLSFLAKYLLKSRDFEYQYKLATVDGLTELYNHRYFQETLKKQIDISKRYQQTFSLIIIDIDFFKKFNDTYGHQAGDAVLRQVAHILKNNSRTTDFVCRYGGEEMCIILPNTGTEEAIYLAQRINKAVSEKEFHLNGVNMGTITISVGVATFPDNAQSAQELIERADQGLYYAKEHGRNQVKCIAEDK